MNYHVFSEPAPGHVAHTISSALLRSTDSVRDWLDMTLEEWGPASVKAIDALDKYRGSQEPKETGFDLAFDGQTIFEFLAQRPESAQVFGSAMGNLSKGISHKVERLVENYDWAGQAMELWSMYVLFPLTSNQPTPCMSSFYPYTLSLNLMTQNSRPLFSSRDWRVS